MKSTLFLSCKMLMEFYRKLKIFGKFFLWSGGVEGFGEG
jgi:hypothetical protein